MTSPPALSPLAVAALAVVGDSADARDVSMRLAAAGARLAPGIADALLAELTAFGLVRVSRGTGRGRRFVLTSLGQRAVGASLTGNVAVTAEELERLRTDVLSTIAHEMRTPLTAIRTGVGLLLDPSSQPSAVQRRTLLEAVARNAERMQRVMEDILDLARFRTGGIRLQLRRFDALELARGAAGSLEPLAAGQGTAIVIEQADPLGLVYGDRRRLEQALVNLISNAVWHAPGGERVTLTVTESSSQTRWSVRDEGPGIDPADRTRLFERFYVGRTDRRGAREGTGLGLPTALAIAQAHDGAIEVESEPGMGSTFTLVVPTDGPEGAE